MSFELVWYGSMWIIFGMFVTIMTIHYEKKMYNSLFTEIEWSLLDTAGYLIAKYDTWSNIILRIAVNVIAWPRTFWDFCGFCDYWKSEYESIKQQAISLQKEAA